MYTITLYTLGHCTADDPETFEFDLPAFIDRCGIERAEYNLTHLWAAVRPDESERRPAIKVNFH